MAAYVTFFLPSSAGSAIGCAQTVTARESVTLPGSTTRKVQPGELVIVYNGESSASAVAWGSSPDADTTAATSTSTAGFPIPATSESPPFAPPAGVLINIKAL